jgi:LAO/AO transport system kinase
VAERGDGVDEVLASIAAHHDFLTTHGELVARRERRAAAEVEHIALGMLRSRLGRVTVLPALAADVAAGRTDPYTAARTLVASLS